MDLTNYDKISILKMNLEGSPVDKIAGTLSLDIGNVINYLDEVKKNPENISLTETSFKEIVIHYEELVRKLQSNIAGMSHINNYTTLFEKYTKTSIKPDKKYSMLYTTLYHINENTIINKDQKNIGLDVGCGAGFFTTAMSDYFDAVIGIDNNQAQIASAKSISEQIGKENKNIDYFLEDMRTYQYQNEYFNCINAPFVINYSKTVAEMKSLFQKRYNSLKPGGILFSIIDNPSDIVHNNKQFGSIKVFPGKKMVDSAIIELMLYNGDEYLCTLYSCYYKKNTIEGLLKEVGFSDIQWKSPLISPEGIEKEGVEFRSEYMKNCDILYLYAKK